jgi:hypothetical protein
MLLFHLIRQGFEETLASCSLVDVASEPLSQPEAPHGFME